MPSRELDKLDREYLMRLGKRVERIIIVNLGFRSLDAFAMRHSKLITKPTLYEICSGKRDMKVSTLRSLAKALDMSFNELVQDK